MGRAADRLTMPEDRAVQMPEPSAARESLRPGTKAETLERLRPLLRKAGILPLDHFTVAEWRADGDAVLRRVLATWPDTPLIVRSSALAEDRAEGSMAGRFLSIQDVRGAQALRGAVDEVIASYGAPGARDQVLVQPMLADVACSGVLFGVDPATNAPYRIVNYADGDDTAAVTGGRGGRTLVRHARAPFAPPPRFAGLLEALDELEALFPGMPLDVEFAITADGRTWILQVRQLVLRAPVAEPQAHALLLGDVAQKVATGIGPHPFLHGRRTVYGVMPDWNPAEIIGVRPRPLALSLYRELVTDSIWAYQRNNYGYKNLRSFPLMLHFHGLPYIDVRVSFNSFIPRDIEGSLADRLVDHYIERLLATPHLHDKVEFEVVFSCYTLDLPQRIASLREAGFSADECARLVDSLRHLTNRVIHGKTGLWREDRARLDTLQARRDQLMASSLDPVSRIYWLLEDCKRYGTLPFAGLARAGFIAVQMLRSLVASGVLSQDDYDRFMRSLDTVSSQLPRDLATLDRSTFLARYGHLRPGTYDILSPRYDEAPELYFGAGAQARTAAHEAPPQFALSLPQMREISRLLQEHGLEHDVVGLFDFLQAGIELREYAKFVFTRNLSDALALMRETGARLGFPTEEISFAHVGAFYEMHASACDRRDILARSIEQGARRHATTNQVALPPLVAAARDAWEFERLPGEPNYVTQRRVVAGVCTHEQRERLAGSIVLIPSADPGFDWLFAHPIAGLVTAYGGANSHMAIRANELGLPAVIGAGEVLFEKWSKARRLDVDCANRRVEVVA
jgi:phosphohistidine swiveling domain-containing protein